jgi:hypothetical protein
MGSFGLSNGDRENNSVIDRKIKEAKSLKRDQLIIDEAMFCERCGLNNGFLDMSHIISVKECKESGRAEIAYDVDNIELLCRPHHMDVESLTKVEREVMYFNKKIK